MGTEIARAGEKTHFIAAAGSGVSALAQFHAMGGAPATGSDRSFDRGLAGDLRAKLEALGVRLYPQDGSALDGSHALAVASAAVEEGNADLERARALGLEVLHRAECLARHAARHRTIAVAGTSGKSTVVAMIFEILEAAGLSPSVITGGALRSLQARGLVGNAWRGRSDLLVIEADESDGTLSKYSPWLGVLLNASKDHRELPEILGMFREFRGRCREFVVQAGAPGLEPLAEGAATFSASLPPRGPGAPRGAESGAGSARAATLAEDVALGPEGSRFKIGGAEFTLPAPGLHNVQNAAAAVAACLKAGVSLETAAAALARFEGVARRLQKVGEAGGVRVIDDFAHNPAKVAAALAAARLQGRRVLAVFQLHGYAPARLMGRELAQAFAASLAPGDILWLPEIYYAGGTASKDISASQMAAEISSLGREARFFPERGRVPREVAAEARSGDVVLVMGARDPTLSEFAREILKELGARGGG